jgi:hypothetical protein
MGTWYRYLTNVLSPEQLSAEEVCDLYRRRWTGEVAIALNQPNEKISVEIVFRSLYYVAKAIAKDEKPNTVNYLAERAKLFGLVKAERKRHREKDALNRRIWEPLPLS